MNQRRRGFKLAGTAVVSVAALGGWLSGCAANAQGAAADGAPPVGGGGWFGHGPGSRHGPDFGPNGGPGGPPDPARAERFLAWQLDRLGATPDQKERIQAIARQAMASLQPYHERMRENRRSGVQLLAAASIDRAAFDGLRAVQLKDFDASSAIISKAMLDAAEVLTPEQRVKVRERMERRHGRQ